MVKIKRVKIKHYLSKELLSCFTDYFSLLSYEDVTPYNGILPASFVFRNIGSNIFLLEEGEIFCGVISSIGKNLFYSFAFGYPSFHLLEGEVDRVKENFEGVIWGNKFLESGVNEVELFMFFHNCLHPKDRGRRGMGKGEGKKTTSYFNGFRNL